MISSKKISIDQIESSSLTTRQTFNAFTASYSTGSFTGSFIGRATGSFTGSFTGSLFGTASWSLNSISSSQAINAQTASFAPNYTLSSSFNNFTSSYNTGSFTGSFTGSLFGTSSWSTNATTASFITGSNIFGPFGSNSIISSSFTISSSQAISSSFASTASFLNTLNQDLTFNGNLTLNGTASISTLVVNQTQYSSGSNQLGDGIEDTQTLFGTVRIPTGSLTVTGSITATQGLTGDYLQVSISSLASIEAGKIVWNSADGTFDMGLLNGVTLQAGQEMHMYAKASGAISNGDAIQFAGAQGDHLLIKKAVPSEINDNPEYFVGVATQDFANNQFGYVTVFGQVRGLDTDDYPEGTVLYYQSGGSTTGLLTDVRPTGPNAKITVAAVVRSHQNQGAIFVRPHVMSRIGALQDVEIDNVTNNEVLSYNSSNEVWENKTLSEAGIQPTLVNPITGTGASGQVAFFNGTTTQTGDNGLFWDNTNKRLGVGSSATPQARLDVRAQGELSTDIAFRVRNSADTGDLLNVNGAGDGFFKRLSVGASSGLASWMGEGAVSAGEAYFSRVIVGGQSSGFDLYGGYINSIYTGDSSRSWDSVKPFAIQTFNGGRTWLYINTSGNIGIGTTSPQARLDVRAQGALSTDIAFRVRNSTDTANLIELNGLGRLGLGVSPTSKFDVQAEQDTAVLGAELLTSSGWTTTGWTGNFTSGFTHTVGNTSVLSNSFVPINNTLYQVLVTISGRTAGSVTVNFGGITQASVTTNTNISQRTISTSNLQITPTSDFDGTISVSIKTISAYSPTIQFRNASGTVTNEVRVSSSNLNTFIGLNTGRLNTTGNFNSFFGQGAGQNNTTGNANSFFGNQAGSNNITGNFNSFFGQGAGQKNTTGNENSFFGYQAGSNNTTGNYNSFFGFFTGISNTTGNSNSFFGFFAGQKNTTGINNSSFGLGAGQNNTTGNANSFFGLNSGRLTSNGNNLTIANNSVFIGYDTRPNADNETNQIVIGHNTIGLGSNSAVLGNTSITRTALRGQTSVNTDTVDTSAQLQVDSTTRGFLPPRMTTTQRDAIASPAAGLIVYDTTENKHYGFNGTSWASNLTNTGDQSITGSLSISQGITGSLFGTASFASTASFAISSSNAQTASFLNTLNQDLTFNGNLTLNGTASISTLVINQTQYSSGSNQLGDGIEDTQTLFGTVRIPTGSLTVTGSISSTSLTGSDSRIVVADPQGTLQSTTQTIIQAYLDPNSSQVGLLNNTSNWDIYGIYTGPQITDTFQGQKHYNTNYFFEAVDDNVWIRLIRG